MANAQIHPLFREILRAVSDPPAIRMCPACYGDLSEPCEECGSRGWTEVETQPEETDHE